MKRVRIIFMLIALLVPVMASAMKITTDEVDEFTGKRTLITSWESICNHKIHLRFRLQNGNYLLDYKMSYDEAMVIGKQDKLMFKSTTDNIGTFESISMYSGTKGGGAVGLLGSNAWGISATYEGELSYFENNVTRLIRIYSTDGYIDNKVSQDDGKKLEKLYSMFMAAQDKEVGKGTVYANYTIIYLKSNNGGKDWEKVDEKYFKSQSPEEIQSIMDNWKTKSSGKKLFDCHIKKGH